MIKCTLDRSLHDCPYLGKGQECLRTDTCSMQEKETIKEKYIRKPRWYEEIQTKNKDPFKMV